MKPPRLLAISDLDTLVPPLEEWLATLAANDIDALLIRERRTSDRELVALLTRCRAQLPTSTRLLVSARLDLALAAGADGVHLPAAGLPLAPLRALAEGRGKELLFGRSTHTLDEVAAARDEGADYVSFGPVYPTPSKAELGTPRGLEELRQAVALGLPVLALGGVRPERMDELRRAGVAGVAAIRAFQSAAETERLARAFDGGA